uniref:Uncharacterized protein n=1 Tax=Zea mays TaxID=4577 RepID=A0A804MUW2_MAIZE
MATTAIGSGRGSGTAALCFLVACLLLASPSSFVAGTEAAAAYVVPSRASALVAYLHLVHLPLVPLLDGAVGGGRGACQGAAPCHDLVHLQDPMLSVECRFQFILCQQLSPAAWIIRLTFAG